MIHNNMKSSASAYKLKSWHVESRDEVIILVDHKLFECK
jgi:hypothetical protein